MAASRAVVAPGEAVSGGGGDGSRLGNEGGSMVGSDGGGMAPSSPGGRGFGRLRRRIIDGDGNLDIVVGRDDCSDTTILLNNKGNGRSYVEHVQFKKQIRAISIGDIDKDDKVDIVK